MWTFASCVYKDRTAVREEVYYGVIRSLYFSLHVKGTSTSYRATIRIAIMCQEPRLLGKEILKTYCWLTHSTLFYSSDVRVVDDPLSCKALLIVARIGPIILTSRHDETNNTLSLHLKDQANSAHQECLSEEAINDFETNRINTLHRWYRQMRANAKTHEDANMIHVKNFKPLGRYRGQSRDEWSN